RSGLGMGSLSLRGRVLAELDFEEPLPSYLAGIFEIDLADIAQALAALLPSDPVLNDPRGAGPTRGPPQAHTEARHRVVPLEMLGFAIGQAQGGDCVFCQLHGESPSFLGSKIPSRGNLGSVWEAALR